MVNFNNNSTEQMYYPSSNMQCTTASQCSPSYQKTPQYVQAAPMIAGQPQFTTMVPQYQIVSGQAASQVPYQLQMTPQQMAQMQHDGIIVSPNSTNTLISSNLASQNKLISQNTMAQNTLRQNYFNQNNLSQNTLSHNNMGLNNNVLTQNTWTPSFLNNCLAQNNLMAAQILARSIPSSFACVQRPAPQFCGRALINDEIRTISLDEYRNNYLALIFYPFDFSPVCQSELLAFAEASNKFADLGCKLVAVSTDSEQAHLAFRASLCTQNGLQNANITLLSDSNKAICSSYGVLLDNGASMRATFIIDPRGTVRSVTINDLAVARNVDEVIRSVAAIKATDETRTVCPVNWTIGSKTVQPNAIDLSMCFQQQMTI